MMKKVMMIGSVVLLMLAGIAMVSAHEAGEESDPVPEKYKDLVNPIPATVESLSDGKAIYEEQCASCHGVDGKAVMTCCEMPDFTDPVMMSEMSDGQMFAKVSDGVNGTHMSPWKDVLTEEERWNVIGYVRTLSIAGTGDDISADTDTSSDTVISADTDTSSSTTTSVPAPASGGKGVCGPTALILIGIVPLALYRIRRRK